MLMSSPHWVVRVCGGVFIPDLPRSFLLLLPARPSSCVLLVWQSCGPQCCAQQFVIWWLSSIRVLGVTRHMWVRVCDVEPEARPTFLPPACAQSQTSSTVWLHEADCYRDCRRHSTASWIAYRFIDRSCVRRRVICSAGVFPHRHNDGLFFFFFFFQRRIQIFWRGSLSNNKQQHGK